MKLWFLTFCLVPLCLTGHSQNNAYSTRVEPNAGVAIGYSGLHVNMLEVGIGYQPWPVSGFFMKYPFAGFLGMFEFDPTSKLYGTTLNAWYLAGFFSCGLGFNRYAMGHDETYGIKPMIGISSWRIGIMYGYNFFVSKNSIENLPHSSFTVKYYLPLWKKE